MNVEAQAAGGVGFLDYWTILVFSNQKKSDAFSDKEFICKDNI